MKEIKFYQKSARNTGKLHDNIQENKNQYLIIDILDELDEAEQEIFLDRMSNMTIAEMATKYGKNRESTRRKMHKVLNKVAKKFA